MPKQRGTNFDYWYNKGYELSIRVVFALVTIMRGCLWEFAVWTYFPGWMLGNRFQSWWYFQNSRLLEWLTWQLLIDLATAEALLNEPSEEVG